MSNAQPAKTSRVARAVWRAMTLSQAEKHFALRAWFLAPVLESALSVWGLDSLLAWLRRLPAHSRSAEILPLRAEELVAGALQYQPLMRGRCLPMALTQFVLHRRDGCEATLVVGVRRDGGSLAAHAWVEPSSQDVDMQAYASILRVEALP